MGVLSFPPPGSGTPLSLVSADGQPTAPARSGCGDICVFFEPSATVVRLYGRVDDTMRTELAEAAFDMVDRGAPVTIEVAPDADIQPVVLQFLQNVCRFGFPGAEGSTSACVGGHERVAGDAARGPARRRLPLPRTGAAGSRR